MTEKDLISQLKKFKAVEPDKNWVMAARDEVLSKTPVFDCAAKTGFNISAVRGGNRTDADLSRLGSGNAISGLDNLSLNEERSPKVFGFRFLFNLKQFQPAMASLMIGMLVLGGGSILAAKAAQNSLPGDSLYAVKRMMEGTEMTITPDNKKAILETKFVGRRVEEIIKVSENISDVEQGGKIEKLEKEIKEGAKNVLAYEKNAKAAKIVNTQMDKYASALVDIDVDKELAVSVEKVSFQALGMLVNASEGELEEAGTSKEEVVVLLQEEIESRILNLEFGDGEDVEQAEIKTDEAEIDEIEVEMEKVEVDCSECDEDDEEICLKETDDKENIKCYIEQAVSTTEDELDKAQENLDKENLAAAVENIAAADEIGNEGGEVKGAEDDGKDLREDEEEVLDKEEIDSL